MIFEWPGKDNIAAKIGDGPYLPELLAERHESIPSGKKTATSPRLAPWIYYLLERFHFFIRHKLPVMKNQNFSIKEYPFHVKRRDFVKQSILLGTSLAMYGGCKVKKEEVPPFTATEFPQGELSGGLKRVDGPEYIPNGQWYEGIAVNDGISYKFPAEPTFVKVIFP